MYVWPRAPFFSLLRVHERFSLGCEEIYCRDVEFSSVLVGRAEIFFALISLRSLTVRMPASHAGDVDRPPPGRLFCVFLLERSFRLFCSIDGTKANFFFTGFFCQAPLPKKRENCEEKDV